MQARTIVLAAILAAGSSPALARTLEVGPGKQYQTLPAAAWAARDGDTVDIFPGKYTKGAVWYADNLKIRMAPGYPLESVLVTGGSVYGKGLFVIKGDNVTVEGIKFQHARVPSGNGAGIRAEGRNLTVKNSIFYKNEMGILGTPRSAEGGTLRIENSRFHTHGSHRGGSLGHSVYANNYDQLVVTNSQFYRTRKGHYIKSRALSTTVTDTVIDDSNGSASYLIEVAEGGAATITRNRLVKGRHASNCCIAIQYGYEMRKGGSYVNPAGPVLIADNDFYNKRPSTVYFASNRSKPMNLIALEGNRLTALSGRVRALYGPGRIERGEDAEDLSADAPTDAELLAESQGDDSFSMEDVIE